jgi:hypothetical protein
MRHMFKRVGRHEPTTCTEPYQLCDAPTSIKDGGALIPALSELFVFFTWAMLAHTEPDTLRQETHEEKNLCQFPNGALWQPALPC